MPNGDGHRHTDEVIRQISKDIKEMGKEQKEMYAEQKVMISDVKKNQEWLKDHETKIDKHADRLTTIESATKAIKGTLWFIFVAIPGMVWGWFKLFRE